LLQRFDRGADVVGLLPSGRDRDGNGLLSWFGNMRVVEYDSTMRVPFARWRRRVTQVSPESAVLLGGLTHYEQLHFARYSQVTMPSWHDAECVLIGDCAHALDPMPGMGANMALVDASTLCACLEKSTAGDEAAALRRFQRLRQPQVDAYRRAGAWMDALLRTDGQAHALFPDALLRTALAVPGVRRRVVASISGLPP
jgi:2-polyprenyl-6-methoxyphenol hydroxylase-like FAD-dependent oxidoreductase